MASRIPQLLLLLFSGIASVSNLSAQQTNRDVKYPIYYPGPPLGRTNILFSGREATLLPTGGLLQIKGLVILTYRKTGEPELTITAPDCIFDPARSEAYSAGPIEAHSADGRLVIQGAGFRAGTNAALVISNNVVTTIRKDLLADPASRSAQTNSPADKDQFIKILSDSLSYDRTADVATFSKHVRASDTQLELLSDVLNASRSTNGTLEDLSAEGNVVITDKSTGGSATGERAVYTSTNGTQLITLTGNPRWQDGLRVATATTFVYDRLHRLFTAQGKSHMQIPRGSVISSDIFLGPQSAATESTNISTTNLVELFADSIEMQSRLDTNTLAGFVADKNVTILDPATKTQGTGDHASYSADTGNFELTGHAIWQSDQRIAGGEALVYNRTNRSFAARTNAYLKMPLEALSTSLQKEGSTAQRLGTISNLFLEANSDSYEFAGESLVFHDHVKTSLLEDKTIRGTLDCGTLTATFSNRLLRALLAETDVHAHQLPAPNASGKIFERDLKSDLLQASLRTNNLLERLMAQGNVNSWQMQTFTNGAKPVHATVAASSVSASFITNANQVATAIADQNVILTRNDDTVRGDRAVYTGADQTAVLTGRPTWERPDGITFTADAFVYDHLADTIHSSGKYKMIFPLLPLRSNAVASTPPIRKDSP
jgi:lipopolysaccharide transport protein LptA